MARSAWVVLCVLCLGAADALAVVPQVGAVFQREFKGALGRLQEQERELYFNDPVYSSEVVHTGPNASTALVFLDKTRIQVGANSDLVLDRYVYDPAAGTGTAAVSFSTGIFRFITGQMKNKDGYDLRTPSATMVIRGTKLIIFVDDKNNTVVFFEQGDGTAAACRNGASAEVHAGQSALVPATCAGVTVVEGNQTPYDSAVVADLPLPAELSVEPATSSDPPSRAGPSASPF